MLKKLLAKFKKKKIQIENKVDLSHNKAKKYILQEGTLVTYEMLQKYGIDSVIFTKHGELDYSIDIKDETSTIIEVQKTSKIRKLNRKIGEYLNDVGYFDDIEDVYLINTDFKTFMQNNYVECIVSPANSFGLMSKFIPTLPAET